MKAIHGEIVIPRSDNSKLNLRRELFVNRELSGQLKSKIILFSANSNRRQFVRVSVK